MFGGGGVNKFKFLLQQCLIKYIVQYRNNPSENSTKEEVNWIIINKSSNSKILYIYIYIYIVYD